MGLREDCKLQAVPEPSRDIYVGRLLPSLTVQDVRDHAKEEGLRCLEVAKLSSDNAPFASFRIKLSMAHTSKALSGSAWPRGAVVGKYYSPRPKKNPSSSPESADDADIAGNATDNNAADRRDDASTADPFANASDATELKSVAASLQS